MPSVGPATTMPLSSARTTARSWSAPARWRRSPTQPRAPAISERNQLLDALRGPLGEVEVLSLDQVSPVVAEEIVHYSSVAVLAACLGILAYLWWAFRKVPRSIRYGSCAVVALVHDAIGLLGIFSLLGRFTTIELDAMFITAVLTTIGFSVHDTIVVFDRIRENIVRHAGEPFSDIVNHSLIQTLGRSINTSVTSFLTLLALYMFGGSTIQSFVLAILIGVALGTYSSIFNASLLLYSWEAGELKRLPALLLGGRGLTTISCSRRRQRHGFCNSGATAGQRAGGARSPTLSGRAPVRVRVRTGLDPAGSDRHSGRVRQCHMRPP